MNKATDILTTLGLLGGGMGFGYFVTHTEPVIATLFAGITAACFAVRISLSE